MNGGYYFDVDIKPLSPFIPSNPSTTSFVSVLSCGGGCLFQAFFACAPRHPLLLRSLELMVDNYESGGDSGMLGPIIMGKALWEKYGAFKESNEFEFLEEILLDIEENTTLYPDVPRQSKKSTDHNCNYAVHHPDRKVVYFFSRFVGYGGCPLEAGDDN